MNKTLLEQLPQIVANGKRQAEQIMERAEGSSKIGLATRELVIPSRDTISPDLLRSLDQARTNTDPTVLNRLIYGNNQLAIAALLAGDETHGSMRSKVDLIYIDPPFDSKADYRHKIFLPDGALEQMPTILEQYAYADTWANGTTSYLEMLTPTLYLMKGLMSETGSIFIHLDWHVGHYVKIIMDEIFGKDHFINEIVWYYYNKMQGNVGYFAKNHDVIFWYKKGDEFTFNRIREERDQPVKQLKRVWNKETQKLVNAKGADGKVLYIEA